MSWVIQVLVLTIKTFYYVSCWDRVRHRHLIYEITMVVGMQLYNVYETQEWMDIVLYVLQLMTAVYLLVAHCCSYCSIAGHH